MAELLEGGFAECCLALGKEEVEYRGWLTIKQETGDNRRDAIAAGVSFLRRFVT